MKFFMILMVLFVSCGTMLFVGQKYTVNGTMVEVLENGSKSRVEYNSYGYLLSKLEQERGMQMWSEERYLTAKSCLPVGGEIFVHITGPSIGSADTKYWEYVVQTMDGVEVMRKVGEERIPRYTASQYGVTWWNLDIISIKEKISGPFKVYVLDRLMNKRSGFIIYP